MIPPTRICFFLHSLSHLSVSFVYSQVRIFYFILPYTVLYVYLSSFIIPLCPLPFLLTFSPSLFLQSLSFPLISFPNSVFLLTHLPLFSFCYISSVSFSFSLSLFLIPSVFLSLLLFCIFVSPLKFVFPSFFCFRSLFSAYVYIHYPLLATFSSSVFSFLSFPLF